MLYIRVSDGQTVPRDEACSAAGMVKPGYSVRVAMIADGQRVSFMDGVQPIADGVVRLTDAEARLAVARARQVHDAAHAYLGSRAPAFSDAQARAAETAAVERKRASIVDASAVAVRDAVTVSSRFMLDQANARRRAAIAGGWRK